MSSFFFCYVFSASTENLIGYGSVHTVSPNPAITSMQQIEIKNEPDLAPDTKAFGQLNEESTKKLEKTLNELKFYKSKLNLLWSVASKILINNKAFKSIKNEVVAQTLSASVRSEDESQDELIDDPHCLLRYEVSKKVTLVNKAASLVFGIFSWNYIKQSLENNFMLNTDLSTNSKISKFGKIYMRYRKKYEDAMNECLGSMDVDNEMERKFKCIEKVVESQYEMIKHGDLLRCASFRKLK